MLVVGLALDQLVLAYDVVPATIPPAVVLVGAEAWRRRQADRGLHAGVSPRLAESTGPTP